MERGKEEGVIEIGRSQKLGRVQLTSATPCPAFQNRVRVSHPEIVFVQSLTLCDHRTAAHQGATIFTILEVC